MTNNQEAEKLEAMAESLRGDFGSEYVKDAASMLEKLAAEKRKAAEFQYLLWDTQWMNIVNHDNAYLGWFLEDAIAHAVKATEAAMARNIADGKWPTTQLPSPDQDREVSP